MKFKMADYDSENEKSPGKMVDSAFERNREKGERKEVQKPGSRAGKGYFDHRGWWQYGERPGKERTTRAAEKQLGLGPMKPAADEKKDEDIREGVRGANVAKTILQQLGGNKFQAMTGAKDFVSSGSNSLSFKIPKNASGANGVHIQLTEDDTYDVEFVHAKTTGGYERKTVKKLTGVHADQLQSTFKEITGMDTSLGTAGGETMKSAPPGWSGTVEHMKQHKDISNPFALAWSMKKKGMRPHYAEVKKAGIEGCALCLKAAFDAGMMKGGRVLSPAAGLYLSGRGKVLHLA